MEVSGVGGRAGTVPSWAAACGVNVVRAAHAELVVTDLDRAAEFYGGLLGFVETERDAEALYYRGYEEREHHSLILRRGARPAVSHIADSIAGAISNGAWLASAVAVTTSSARPSARRAMRLAEAATQT